MRDLGLLGTPWALILFYSGLQLPFTVFLYIGSSARCPPTTTRRRADRRLPPSAGLRYVVFPLLSRSPVTALMLNAVPIWNDFFTPLLYLGGSGRETVPVRVFAFVNQYASDYGLVAAGLVLAALPILRGVPAPPALRHPRLLVRPEGLAGRAGISTSRAARQDVSGDNGDHGVGMRPATGSGRIRPVDLHPPWHDDTHTALLNGLGSTREILPPRASRGASACGRPVAQCRGTGTPRRASYRA